MDFNYIRTKMKTGKPYLLKIIIGIALLIPLGYLMIYSDRQIYKYYSEFNQTNIDGKIESVGMKLHGTSFRIKGNAVEFQFYPYPDKNGMSFRSIASEGARIIKPPYSDTLVLSKDTTEWKFTFQHSDNPNQ